jgi:hypothetical protein
LIVGSVADPLQWDRWPEAETLLEPARARGEFATVIEPDEALYVVLDGDDLLACATAWLSTDGFVEVKLVGGRDHGRWLAELNDVIGNAARAAGANELRAWGRRGWAKKLGALGWAAFPIDKETNGYVRRLTPEGV